MTKKKTDLEWAKESIESTGFACDTVKQARTVKRLINREIQRENDKHALSVIRCLISGTVVSIDVFQEGLEDAMKRYDQMAYGLFLGLRASDADRRKNIARGYTKAVERLRDPFEYREKKDNGIIVTFYTAPFNMESRIKHADWLEAVKDEVLK